MPRSNDFLATGSPSLPSHTGASAPSIELRQAWTATLSGDAAAGLRQVSGSFAVGLLLPSGATLLAVDRFAIETLCYRIVDGELQFASRADDLADADTPLEPQALYDYLFFHAIPSPRTIFRGVQRLPPGHFARFEAGRLVVAPYWVATFPEPVASPSFDDLKASFRRLLRESVARALDGGKPGCFLSGGTDSSTVAGMIGEAAGRPAATYSIGFEAQGYDEMAFARIAARRFGTEHHEYYVTPADLVRSISDVAGFYDQPFGNSSALPAFYCARMAREDGVARLLAGDGGDELFGGNSRYAKQRIFGWYEQLPAALRSGVIQPLFERTPLGRLPLLRKGTSYIEQAKVPLPDRLQMYNLLLRLGIDKVLTPEFLAQVDSDAPQALQRKVWAEAATDQPLNRTLAFDWRFTLAESDLPKVRETTRLAGVEVAFPLLDQALLDFSLTLKTNHKLKGLKLRWFFKEALRGFLPDEILTKKKQGFGLPFGVWATQNPTLLALASESLHSLATRGIVRPAFIDSLLKERLREHPGYYGEMVWILMMLEQWLLRHRPDARF